MAKYISNMADTHLKCSDQENVGFLDFRNDTKVGVVSVTDPTVLAGKQDNDSLANFLARPVQIFATSWAPGANINANIDPWALWAANNFVKNKLNNFAYFRGDLTVQIKINGTPFHYGKILASYRPLHDYSQLYEPVTIADNDAEFIEVMMTKSQRLSVQLDPSCDKGGCMCLPFVWPKNMMNVTDLAEWGSLGQLSLNSMVQLKTASSAATDINITIFAYCENPVLTVPTYTLAAQAGDEYNDDEGPISAPATAVAKVATVLSSVPIIGPFAMASAIGANAVSAIAKLFGYSKPALIKAATFMIHTPVGNMANTIGEDNTMKLTFDPKQETTIDPRVTGTNSGDEMAIGNIITRESYLTYFTWAISGNAGDSLFYMPINPSLSFATPLTNETRLASTALAFGVRPFQYWSGSIILRFEIMASQYHKGRLKIAWDPFSTSNALQNDNLNVNYIKIIDLAETRNYEMCINWAKDAAYAEVELEKLTNWIKCPIRGVPGAANQAYCNGQLGISILNELVAPVDTADIRVNVYIKAGDDFEVAGPFDGPFGDISYFEYDELGAQAGPEIDTSHDDNADDSIKTDVLTGSPPNVMDQRAGIFFGERLLSFRNLVKRYNYVGAYFLFDGSNSSDSDITQITVTNSNFPEYYGFDPDARFLVKPALVDIPFNPVKVTLMGYLTPAYICRRGGLRQMYSAFNSDSSAEQSGVLQIRVDRQPDDNATFDYVTDTIMRGNVAAPPWPSEPVPADMYAIRGTGFQGSYFTPGQKNSVLKVDLPYYNIGRFYCAQNLRVLANAGMGAPGTYPNREKHDVKYLVMRKSNIAKSQGIDRYISASEDFSLSYFLSAPIGYVYDTPLPKIVDKV